MIGLYVVNGEVQTQPRHVKIPWKILLKYHENTINNI